MCAKDYFFIVGMAFNAAFWIFEILGRAKKELEEKRSLLASLDEIIKANKGKALATVIENNRKDEQAEFERLIEQIEKLKIEKNAIPRLNREQIRKKMQEYKAALDGIDFYKRQEILQTLVENVKIGNNVTIGAGSVVTKDIPDNATAVGNYAKVINYNNPGRYIKNPWEVK